MHDINGIRGKRKRQSFIVTPFALLVGASPTLTFEATHPSSKVTQHNAILSITSNRHKAKGDWVKLTRRMLFSHYLSQLTEGIMHEKP